jgi:nitroreductase/NAD-dependent dihydropyrimidine dehydrogenase PreA subunit
MSKLIINTKLCKQDGLCAKECPAGIISIKEKESFPGIQADFEDVCIKCGHCLAVCPTGALSMDWSSAKDLQPVSPFIDADKLKGHFLGRRSIRQYKNETLEKQTLTDLIDIARFAPSAHNSQSIKWLVIQDQELLKELTVITIDWLKYLDKTQKEFSEKFHLDRQIKRYESGVDVILREAPCVIAVYGQKNDRLAQTTATIALAHLELAAPSFGAGCCWAGFFNSAAMMYPPMIEALNLPEDNILFGSLMIGKPKARYYRIPERKKAEINWR